MNRAQIITDKVANCHDQLNNYINGKQSVADLKIQKTSTPDKLLIELKDLDMKKIKRQMFIYDEKQIEQDAHIKRRDNRAFEAIKARMRHMTTAAWDSIADKTFGEKDKKEKDTDDSDETQTKDKPVKL